MSSTGWVIAQAKGNMFVVGVEDDGNCITWGDKDDAVIFTTKFAANDVAIGRGGVRVQRAGEDG